MEQIKDDFLLEEIKNALTRELNSVDIDLNIEKGKVTLSGFVDVLAEKNHAEKVIARIPGVVAIDNSLTVAVDNMVTDKEITEGVLERFQANPLETVRGLGAKCKGGVVILEGHVNSAAEKMAALQAAAQVRGVKEVISHLTFNQEANIDDASISSEVKRQLLRTSQDQESGDVKLTHQLREILRKHHLSQVKAFVIDGTVFLAGEVYAVDQKGVAEKVARNLEGIRGISNDIEIISH